MVSDSVPTVPKNLYRFIKIVKNTKNNNDITRVKEK